jgi:hypothetical protein
MLRGSKPPRAKSCQHPTKLAGIFESSPSSSGRFARPTPGGALTLVQSAKPWREPSNVAAPFLCVIAPVFDRYDSLYWDSAPDKHQSHLWTSNSFGALDYPPFLGAPTCATPLPYQAPKELPHKKGDLPNISKRKTSTYTIIYIYIIISIYLYNIQVSPV